MDGGLREGSGARFAVYIEALGAVLGDADRQEPMRDYCLGLLMAIERESVDGGSDRTGAACREASILA